MILDKIQSDFKIALKEKDALSVSTLRLLLAAIHNKEIELIKKDQLTDDEVVSVIRKEAKQRRESIDAYQKAKRDDLADKEERELAILSKYLPQEISPEELKKIIQEIIAEIGAAGPKDFGKVMGQSMSRLKGKADGNQVAEVVKKLLSN